MSSGDGSPEGIIPGLRGSLTFRINYGVLLQLAPYAAALAGILVGMFVFEDLSPAILLAGAGYIATRLLVFLKYHT